MTDNAELAAQEGRPQRLERSRIAEVFDLVALPTGRILSWVVNALYHLTEAIVITALVAEIVVMFLTVMLRWLFDVSLAWSPEVGTLCLQVLVFGGGAIAYRRSQHVAIGLIRDRLGRDAKAIVAGFVDMMIVAVSAAWLKLSWSLLDSASTARLPVLGISGVWTMVPLVGGMALIVLFSLERLVRERPFGRAVIGVAIAALATSTVIVLHSADVGLDAGASWITIGATLALLLLGVPVSFTLASSALIFLYTSGLADPVAVPLTMQGSMDNFVLLAIPAFILAGIIMDIGGVTTLAIDFARTLVGRFHGGLLQVQVVTMYLFSGVSGSETADVSAVGSSMAGSMRARGYAAGETAAVLASAAAMGITVPPSISALVLASVSSLSVGALFAAGIIPAAVIALVLMVVISFRARRLGMPRDAHRSSFSEVRRSFVKTIPVLAMGVVVVGAMVTGVATPTEVSAISVFYAAILCSVFYRSLSLRTVWQATSDTVALVGMVLFMISAANAFAWMLVINQIPQRVASSLADLPLGIWLFLPLSIGLVVMLGSLLEGLPALLVLAPILLPIASRFGIDPVHYGVVLIFSMGIGGFAPPIGVGFMVACGVTGATVEEASRSYVPYFFALLVGVLIIAFVPWLTLVLPQLVGLG